MSDGPANAAALAVSVAPVGTDELLKRTCALLREGTLAEYERGVYDRILQRFVRRPTSVDDLDAMTPTSPAAAAAAAAAASRFAPGSGSKSGSGNDDSERGMGALRALRYEPALVRIVFRPATREQFDECLQLARGWVAVAAPRVALLSYDKGSSVHNQLATGQAAAKENGKIKLIKEGRQPAAAAMLLRNEMRRNSIRTLLEALVAYGCKRVDDVAFPDDEVPPPEWYDEIKVTQERDESPAVRPKHDAPLVAARVTLSATNDTLLAKIVTAHYPEDVGKDGTPPPSPPSPPSHDAKQQLTVGTSTEITPTMTTLTRDLRPRALGPALGPTLGPKLAAAADASADEAPSASKHTVSAVDSNSCSIL